MNNNLKILLVEDDENFGDVLKSYLEMNDFHVDHAKDGLEGLDYFEPNKYQICISDVMMPKMDGFSMAKRIRESDPAIPIIFLTARTLKEDIIEGFKIGGDDYITKPFNSQELLYRVKAIIKRSELAEQKEEATRDEFEIGKFKFNYLMRTLIHENGDKAKLSPKESELLRLFSLNLNEVLQRTEALDKIWGEDNYFTARSMDVFITKLRKYLEQDPEVEIVNIHGSGFRLVAPRQNKVDSNS